MYTNLLIKIPLTTDLWWRRSWSKAPLLWSIDMPSLGWPSPVPSRWVFFPASFSLSCLWKRSSRWPDLLISSRVSVWTGASNLMWDCRSRTLLCFYSSVQLRLLSEVSLEKSDTRPVFFKEQFRPSLNSWWRIPQSTGRYDAGLDGTFQVVVWSDHFKQLVM